MRRVAGISVVIAAAMAACVPVSQLIIEGEDERALAQISKSPAAPRDDPGYRKALPEAAFAGKAEIVQALIGHGADLDARTGDVQITPLHYAVHWNTKKIHRDAVRVLLEGGADPNVLNRDMESPLHYMLYREVDPTQYEDKERVVRLLLEHGADAAARTSGGLTPLWYAAMRGDSPVILQLLVDHGADLSTATEEGLTAFDIAIANERADAARLLLERGARPRVLLEKADWPPDHPIIHHQFRTSGKGFALLGDWQLARGDMGGARLAFETARRQLRMAAEEYRRAHDVYEAGVTAARAGDVGRAVGSLLSTAAGVAVLATTGIGWVSRPVFTNQVGELEQQAAESAARAEDCERLATEMDKRVADLAPAAGAEPTSPPEVPEGPGTE
jgi:ankyrin repeat protein